MNIVIPLCVLLIVCVFGLFIYRKTLKKLIFYSSFLQFCQSLVTEINYFQNKLPSIILKQNIQGDFGLVLNAYLNNNIKNCLDGITFLTNDEKEEVDNFFSRLGRLNADGERKEIENFIAMLNEKIANLKSFGLKKSKLKFNLCIMLGVLLFIILV